MKAIYLIFTALLIVSCSTTSSGSPGMYPRGDNSDAQANPLSPASSGVRLFSFRSNSSGNGPSQPLQQPSGLLQRKTYYEAYIGIDVANVDETLAKLKESLKAYDAYVVSSNMNNFTVRIRYDQFDSYVVYASGLGKLSFKNIVGNDVTEQYDDLKIQLDNAIKARDRYLKLLEAAETVEEMLQVEKELERITMSIQQLEGRLNRLDQIISYSLVNISVNKEVTPGPVGWVFVGLWEGVSWLLVWD